MIGPTQAEGKVGLPTLQHLLEGALKKLLTIAKPVMVIAESLNASLACQVSLLLTNLRHSQVIKAQVSRQVWLAVSFKQRFGLYHIVPFCKSLAPPLIVLGYGVVLRQV